MTQNILQTTIAGSLPKPEWLAEPLRLWSPWKLAGEELAAGKNDAVRLVLRDQERAGIDIVTDGEQTRQHFVTTFIEHLDGVDFQRREKVRIRDRYDADVPVVTGPVSRKQPVYVDYARFLRSETSRPIKFAILLALLTITGFLTLIVAIVEAAGAGKIGAEESVLHGLAGARGAAAQW